MRSGRAFQAFVELKSAMVTAHVPALPNYSISFVVETYASDIGILVILMQHDHPISFIGKVLICILCCFICVREGIIDLHICFHYLVNTSFLKLITKP